MALENFRFNIGQAVRVRTDPKDTDPIIGRVILCRAAPTGHDYYIRWSRDGMIHADWIEDFLIEPDQA